MKMSAENFQRICVTLVLFGLAACGGKAKAPGEKTVSDVPTKGNLVQAAAETFRKENQAFFEPCDVANREKIQSLLQDLDSKRVEIEAFQKANAPKTEPSFTQLGTFKFTNPSSTSAPENKWIRYEQSWPQLFKFHDEIKDQPIGAKWATLNWYVRILMTREQARLSQHAFLGASHTSGPELESIAKASSDCVALAECLKPKLTAEQVEFLSNSGEFKSLLASFDSKQSTPEAKRKRLEYFNAHVQDEAAHFRLRKYEQARVEGKTLIVPLDVSAFGDDGEKAIQWLEKSWNLAGETSLKIESIKKPTPGFEVRVFKAEDRAKIPWTKDTMNLFDGASLKSVARDFGFVLGLSAQEFTVWNKTSCTYTIEANPGDIMSAPETGSVLPEHWEQLKKAYWTK